MKRLAIVSLATVATGFVATVLAFLTMPLPGALSGDGDYLAGLRLVASDPFVLGVALTAGAWGTVIALPLALWLLWDVDYRKAIPRVAATTWLAAAILGPLGPLSALGTLFAGGMALVWARANYGLRSRLAERIRARHPER